MAQRTYGRRNHFGAVLTRDHCICQYCYGDATSVDHIVPYTYSLDNTMDNLVACCERCNNLAGSQVFQSFHEKQEWIQTEIDRRANNRARGPRR